MSSKTIILFGSTGSIGTAALDIIRRRPEFRLKHLTFGTNIELALRQIDEFRPDYAGCISKEHAQIVQQKFPFLKEVFWGDGMTASAGIGSDIFIAAVSGSAGLWPTLKAVSSSRRIALANKETMVMAGDLFNDECRKHGTEVIPVDSEHSAIFQCLAGEDPGSVKQLILTASGGPFRSYSQNELSNVTVEMALRHPNWVMGNKITIDSATLANKGLELIEAVKLFGIPENKIDVLIHPQSIVHSMVKYSDNSVKAQLGMPDMRLPIQYALDHPQRLESVINDIDFTAVSPLTFEAPDNTRFPTIGMAREAVRNGGYLPLLFNRANEELVYAFLAGKIAFKDIFTLLEKTMSLFQDRGNCSIDINGITMHDNETKKFIMKEVQ